MTSLANKFKRLVDRVGMRIPTDSKKIIFVAKYAVLKDRTVNYGRLVCGIR